MIEPLVAEELWQELCINWRKTVPALGRGRRPKRIHHAERDAGCYSRCRPKVAQCLLLAAACLPWQAAHAHCPRRATPGGGFKFSKSDALAHVGLQQQLVIIHIYGFLSRPLGKIFSHARRESAGADERRCDFGPKVQPIAQRALAACSFWNVVDRRLSTAP